MFVGLLRTCPTRSFDGSLDTHFRDSTKCASLKKKGSQAWPELFGINSIETIFYLFAVSVNKCGGSCNTILKTFFSW